MVVPKPVHVLLNAGAVLMVEIVGAWIKRGGRLANRLLGKRDPFWAEDYFDGFMRVAEPERQAVRCIENNPPKAKLVLDPKLWPWGGARIRDGFGGLRL